MHAIKQGDKTIVITWTFTASSQRVCDALTKPGLLTQWMKPAKMSLVSCEVDFKAGGTLRYVFQRPSGKKLEVRGTFQTVEPPHRWVYQESYDFSPLKVLVANELKPSGKETQLTQTLTYGSKQESDQDFDPVATSSREAYTQLERYLAESK